MSHLKWLDCRHRGKGLWLIGLRVTVTVLMGKRKKKKKGVIHT